MSCDAGTPELLRSHGLRATWPRQLIATALRHHDGHRHAQAILDEVQVGHPTINPSTVCVAGDIVRRTQVPQALNAEVVELGVDTPFGKSWPGIEGSIDAY